LRSRGQHCWYPSYYKFMKLYLKVRILISLGWLQVSSLHYTALLYKKCYGNLVFYLKKKKKSVRKRSMSPTVYSKTIAQRCFISEIPFGIWIICNHCLKLVHARIQLISSVLWCARKGRKGDILSTLCRSRTRKQTGSWYFPNSH